MRGYSVPTIRVRVRAHSVSTLLCDGAKCDTPFSSSPLFGALRSGTSVAVLLGTSTAAGRNMLLKLSRRHGMSLISKAPAPHQRCTICDQNCHANDFATDVEWPFLPACCGSFACRSAQK